MSLRGYFFSSVIVLLTLVSTISTTVVAQDSTTADGLFTMARNEAFDNNNYNEAIRLSHKALTKNPAYTDITIFLGRLYTWNKQIDSGRYYFSKALAQRSDIEDAYVAYADLEYWEKNYDQSLEIVNKGLQNNSSSNELLLRKAKILYATKEYKTAAAITDTLIQKDGKNTDVRTLANLIKDHVSNNKVGIRYDYASFDKQFPDPWHFASLDYTRQTKSGAYTARVNYANRFKQHGIQYELEAYPIISKTFYTYLNIGYADKAGILPKWKGGASLYANLPKAFEAAVGIRFLYFTSNNLIYTLHLAKYYKNFLFGAQTYLAPVNANISQTYSFLARYYYGDIDDYIGINIGAGISPDNRQINILLDNLYKLRTYRGEVTVQHAVRKLNVFTVNFSLLNQEYLPNTIGNQIQAGLGYIRRF